MDLQSLILNLQRYWADAGCIIQQPYDLEVGAGTMHSETFLRALGPEPYRAAYVQPSRRPADARYGENPFRLGRHLQLQVILKPSPKDVQELYLESLGALGIDRAVHDIRFEEDNWEKFVRGRRLLIMHALFWPVSDIICGAQMLGGLLAGALMARAPASGAVLGATVMVCVAVACWPRLSVTVTVSSSSMLCCRGLRASVTARTASTAPDGGATVWVAVRPCHRTST